MKIFCEAEEKNNAGVEKILYKKNFSSGRLMNGIPSRCQPAIDAYSDQIG